MKAADELKDEDVADRTGFPVIEEPSEEDKSEDEKPDSEEETDEESDEDSENDEESDESTESDESEEDEEEDAEEDEDEPDETISRQKQKPRSTRTVPYDLLKTERQKNKEIRKEIDDIKTILTDLRNKDQVDNKSEEDIDEIEAEAKALAEELGADDPNLSSEALTKILKKAVGIAEKRYGDKLPKDFEKKLELLNTLEKKQKEEAEVNYFNTEFTEVLPVLKKQYPHASEAALKEAKDLLYKVSHTKKYQRYDLADIVNSPTQKKAFDTILMLAPKSKSGENNKNIAVDEDDTEEETLTDIENLSPALMKQREQKEISTRSKRTANQEDDITIIDPLET